jgi:hypothetical protein
MSDDFNGDGDAVKSGRRRDRVVDEAKDLLLAEYFPEGATRVYYGRQVEVGLEERFFHWITSRALNELVKRERLVSPKKERRITRLIFIGRVGTAMRVGRSPKHSD